MIRFRRLVQIFSLVLFLALLHLASMSAVSVEAADLFLRMDPGLALISLLSARMVLFAFIPAALVLMAGLVIGRVFCGYICPMGTTVDATDRLFGPGKRSAGTSVGLSRIKYLVLAFLLGSAILGVSYVFLASPLSLITRFYGLVILPVLTFLSREVLDLVRPLGDMTNLGALSFLQIRSIRFNTQFFILLFFAAVFALIVFSPRFWCRYLCPSGALLALVSRSPLIRRKVSDQCTHCGRCVRACPMSAIDGERPEKTFHSECIVCRTCEDVCPEDAVSFGRVKGSAHSHPAPFSPERRQVVSAGLIGAGAAVISLTGLRSLHGMEGAGQVRPPGLLRPPGAVPETDFLSRCVRCGECMVACPTNTLQPIWFEAGVPALFTPALTPRRGFCIPTCHECGKACPTEAILPLGRPERVWAKTGTARIIREKCLAWEFNKSCMVCDEVCPYDAVEFVREDDHPVPVPTVREARCAGCGYCEYHCPVQNRSAIVVSPMDALRREEHGYEADARARGFTLQLKPSTPGTPSVDEDPEVPPGTAPGFDPI